MRNTFLQYRRAKTEVREAEKRRDQLMEEAMPVGATVWYEHRVGVDVRVVVCGHAYDRLFVRNPDTGREYQVYGNRVCRVRVAPPAVETAHEAKEAQ